MFNSDGVGLLRLKTYAIVTLPFRKGRELMTVPVRRNQTLLLLLEVVLINSR